MAADRQTDTHTETCLLQAGYNLLYGCWKYSWDADCELFLKILRGEVKEDVYVEQIQLQVIILTRALQHRLTPRFPDEVIDQQKTCLKWTVLQL